MCIRNALFLLLATMSLCISDPALSQDITDDTLHTIQDTIPHCWTVKESGPLCYQSKSASERKAVSEEAILKAIEMLEEYEKEKEPGIDKAKESEANSKHKEE